MSVGSGATSYYYGGTALNIPCTRIVDNDAMRYLYREDDALALLLIVGTVVVIINV